MDARRDGSRGWGRPVLAGVLTLALLGGVGAYAAADLADEVPGLLTTAPRPEPYPTLGPAPGARAGDAGRLPVAAVSDQAPTPDPAVLTAQLTPLLAAPELGPSVSATVIDATTGTRLLDDDPAVPHEPASVVKVLTAAASLRALGPDTTLQTTVVGQPGSEQITLLAGGDVLLGAGASNPQVANGRAGLADLAQQVAAALTAQGRTSVRLTLDDSVLGGLGWGEAMGPGWTNADITSGYVAPVTGLAVDAGRIRPQNYAPRVGDPGLDAAQQLAAALRKAGITVQGPATRAKAPAGAPVLGTVSSAPVSEIVTYAMLASDNNAAEALARLVAVKKGQAASFAAGGSAVLAEVGALGVDTSGAALADGSGLSDGSTLTSPLLAGTLAAAAGPQHPELRGLLRGLPVAGLSGTLAERFTGQSASGVGLVRAKTGSLRGVSSLAGVTTTADGRVVTFAILADQAPAVDPARAALDRVASAVAGCGCR